MGWDMGMASGLDFGRSDGFDIEPCRLRFMQVGILKLDGDSILDENL